MAIYKGTALVSQVIGKLGVNDFMRWRNKLVVRVSPITVTDPGSASQGKMRDAMITSGAAWFGTLVEAQRIAWENFAKQAKFLQSLPNGIRQLPKGNGGNYS